MHPIKTIILTAALALSALPATAQMRYGIHLGGEIADARLSNAGNFSMSNRSAFSGGLAIEYQSPKCGFAADIALLYTRYNSRLQHLDGSVSDFGRNYLDIPLHAKYKFPIHLSFDFLAPMIYTGPALSLRLGEGDGTPLSTRRMLPGWDVGIGLDIINFIQLSAGYRFGLGNSVDRFDGFGDAKIAANGWNVSATLLFDF